MGTILYIGDDKAVPDDILDAGNCQHRLAVLRRHHSYRDYIEEHMPDYVLLSEDAEGFDEISHYVSSNPGLKLIITGGKEESRDVRPGITRIESPDTWERFRKIIHAIELADPAGKKDKKQIRFLKQEVISFYSVQGGTGKTSMVFNMAFRLKQRDMGRILVVDLNFCQGPSDMMVSLDLDGSSGMDGYVSEVLSGEADIKRNVATVAGIDILCPSSSLYLSERFSIDVLNDLIFSGRNEYDVMITDLPFRYDNISLEMINLSTTSFMVLSPDTRLLPRIRAFKRFIPANQKKMAVLNRVEDRETGRQRELEDMAGLAVCAAIPFIGPGDRRTLKTDGKMTGMIDLQEHMDRIIDRIF